MSRKNSERLGDSSCFMILAGSWISFNDISYACEILMQCREAASESHSICSSSTLCCWAADKLPGSFQEQRMQPHSGGSQRARSRPQNVGSTSGTWRFVEPLMQLTASQWRLSACEPLHTWISQGAQDHKINPTIILCIFWFWAIIIWMCELCAQNEKAECWSVVIKIVMNFLFQKCDFASCLL